MDFIDQEGGKPPAFIQGDKAVVYKAHLVQNFLKNRNVGFSVSEGCKNGNQVAESFNSNLKKQVATITLEQTHNFKEKKDFLEKLSYQQKN